MRQFLGKLTGRLGEFFKRSAELPETPAAGQGAAIQGAPAELVRDAGDFERVVSGSQFVSRAIETESGREIVEREIAEARERVFRAAGANGENLNRDFTDGEVDQIRKRIADAIRDRVVRMCRAYPEG